MAVLLPGDRPHVLRLVHRGRRRCCAPRADHVRRAPARGARRALQGHPQLQAHAAPAAPPLCRASPQRARQRRAGTARDGEGGRGDPGLPSRRGEVSLCPRV